MFDRADLTRQDGAERIQGGLFMDPYRNLISNTVLFGLSTFGARLLTFLLTPFYTRVLSSAEYGLTDLLLQTGNLIIPIASVGIANAVIRYGLEQSRDKSGVFTIGMLTTLAGFCLLLFLSPLLGQIGFLSGYLHLVLLYVLAANVHSVCSQFARTLGYVRLFALDGILRTALTIVFNILLLAVFPMGAAGYVLANVLADGITTAFVFLCARQWRYLRLSAVKRRDVARMLRYSAPLVPANLCGWIINISDRYLIALLIGSAATGIYAVSNKLPNVLLTAATTFSSAWKLSALSERPRREKERFFPTSTPSIRLWHGWWPQGSSSQRNSPPACWRRRNTTRPGAMCRCSRWRRSLPAWAPSWRRSTWWSSAARPPSPRQCWGPCAIWRGTFS